MLGDSAAQTGTNGRIHNESGDSRQLIKHPLTRVECSSLQGSKGKSIDLVPAYLVVRAIERQNGR